LRTARVESVKSEPPDKDEGVEAAAGVTGGLECLTCGDRFPSQASLEEHVPTHKKL